MKRQGFSGVPKKGFFGGAKSNGDQSVITAVTRIAPGGGAVLREDLHGHMPAAAAYQIWLFKTSG
jgi:hypothetical protein